jgi:hypothetical protein
MMTALSINDHDLVAARDLLKQKRLGTEGSAYGIASFNTEFRPDRAEVANRVSIEFNPQDIRVSHARRSTSFSNACLAASFWLSPKRLVNAEIPSSGFVLVTYVASREPYQSFLSPRNRGQFRLVRAIGYEILEGTPITSNCPDRNA